MKRRRLPKSQTKLIGAPSMTIKVEYAPIKQFYCPYCLHLGFLSNFYVRVKKGISEKRFKCPECGQGMRRDTLTKRMSIEEYAEFIFYTVHAYDGYKRISWDKLFSRLKKLYWASRFWKKYHELKASLLQETEEQYSERRQEEEYYEQQGRYADEHE